MVKNIRDEDHKHIMSLQTLLVLKKKQCQFRWLPPEVYTDVEECLYKTKMYKHNFPQDIVFNAMHIELYSVFLACTNFMLPRLTTGMQNAEVSRTRDLQWRPL